MIKVLTLIAFLSVQIAPMYSFAGEPIVTEFEKSAKELQEKTDAANTAKDKAAKVAELRKQIRDNTIVLAARVEELETLAEEIPNVREDVIEDTARSLQAAETEDDKEDLFGISAVVAVASGVVYALTQVDVPKALASVRASTKPKTAAGNAATVRVKQNSFNRTLKSLYGNQKVARGAAVTGVVATLLAGYAFAGSHTLSLDEIHAVESLENTYLSQLISGGTVSHMSDPEIAHALTSKYDDDAAFRAAVVNEVRTIVAETDRLNDDIAAKKQLIEDTLKQ